MQILSFLPRTSRFALRWGFGWHEYSVSKVTDSGEKTTIYLLHDKALRALRHTILRKMLVWTPYILV